jgi:hypothetical protein
VHRSHSNRLAVQEEIRKFRFALYKLLQQPVGWTLTSVRFGRHVVEDAWHPACELDANAYGLMLELNGRFRVLIRCVGVIVIASWRLCCGGTLVIIALVIVPVRVVAIYLALLRYR